MNDRKQTTIIPKILVFVSVLVVLWILGCHKTPSAKQTRLPFERMADEMPYLDLTAVLYDHDEDRYYRFYGDERKRHFEILRQATDGTYSKEDLLKLLSHPEPKVRTLAAVALFDREDPTVLPELVKLTDDNSPTFDGYMEICVAIELGKPMPNPVVKPKQTVDQIAEAMVAFYMERAGYHYGVKYEGEPGFAEYWETHKDRSYCASWFAVQLARASQGTSPTPKESFDRIHELRKRIDALPPDGRVWVLLWLHEREGGKILVNENELVEMCKALGPDKLLLMLQGKIPSDDPDLQSRPNYRPYHGMAIFVLSHAEQLLRPTDSDALLACELWERDYNIHGITAPLLTEWWAVAAARLQPEKASQILHDALIRFQGEYRSPERSALCAALWQIVGETESKFIIDWMYTEQPERPVINCRASFIKAMQNDAKGKEIIVRIMQDPRFDTIDPETLRTLVITVNNWLDKAFASEDEIRELYDLRPLGPEDEQKYPEATAKLRQQISDWCNRLRASVPKLQGSN